uniref:probable E3 ubiquitin-protein ligase XERICO n=1 Tax=Ziziphus jujuba TaxID=326968 RepID=A0A6P4A557_ZIZJJ
MGLSSLPAPSEGVLCILLVNTALSISIVKGIVRSILHIVGIGLSSSSSSSSHPSSEEDYVNHPSESYEFYCGTPCDNYVEEFRNRVPTIRFDALCGCEEPENECSVCLNRFEPESEINHLSCGHVFHKVCLEKWLDYWNVTCPLCRTPLMPEEELSCNW